MFKITSNTILFNRFDNYFDQTRQALLKQKGFDHVKKIDRLVRKYFVINKSKDYIDGSYFFKKIEDLKAYYQSLNCRYQDYSLELAYLDIIELNANNYFDGTLHAHKGVTTTSFDNKMTKHTTKQKLSLDGLDFKPRRSKQFAFN